MTTADRGVRQTMCTGCGEQRYTLSVLESSGFTAVICYAWLCIECLQRHWCWRYWNAEYRREIVALYAAAIQTDKLETWLAWTLGNQRYQALCSRAVIL